MKPKCKCCYYVELNPVEAKYGYWFWDPPKCPKPPKCKIMGTSKCNPYKKYCRDCTPCNR